MPYTTRRQRRLAERAATRKRLHQRLAAGALSAGVLLGGTIATSPEALAAPVAVVASPTGTASTTSAVNMRSGPSTGYRVVRVLARGATVTKTGTVRGGWTQVRVSGRTGWVSSAYLTTARSTSTGSKGTTKTVANVNVRSGPSTGYRVIGKLHRGTTVTKTGAVRGAWTQVKVDGRTGWVSSRFLRGTTATPLVRTSSTSASWKATASSWAINKANNRSVRYVWGGTGPTGYDCSGFTQAAYAAAGKSLPRSSRTQYTSADQFVSLRNIQVGDLVFWSNNGSASGIYHVAIYVGNGKIAHARNPISGVSVTHLHYSPKNMLGTAARHR
ncbi:SH3 domain-containing protein [Micrococcus terreus]|uniref:C40 family peptidase n=1 Tax=Micrococcus terreus TaxID=574650 RepID=UPI0021A6BA6E|nr:C40 family peptidase [Micrococcus terreus]MCT2089714.1 SH3 domain-containing protein [Micrococcus terreus]